MRFEGNRLRMDVCCERNSNMVFFSISRKDRGVEYDLEEILLALAPELVTEAYCSKTDLPTLYRGLGRVANLCRKQLRGVFKLDKMDLDLIETHVRDRRNRLLLSLNFGNRLGLANRAWETKKWKDAFALYSGAEEALAPYQKRRLEFLRRRLRPK